MDLFNHYTDETTILTPNRRLAATLIKFYNQSQINKKKFSWKTLDTLPISSWVQRLWQNNISKQIGSAPQLLSSGQEQLLWEEILRLSPEGDLLQLSSTAELAKQAYGILQQWQVDRNNPALQTTEDGIIFQNWARQFETLCQEKDWLDHNSLTSLVIEKINQGQIIPPAKIILTGFTELSPQYETLIAACEKAGSHIHRLIQAEKKNQVARLGLSDETTEIYTMARWAKAKWQKNPVTSIGCIFPRLESLRDKVIQIFSEVFAEENTFSLNYLQYPFNISAGKNLSRYPVIATALQLLNLNSKTTSLDVLTHILLSPFVGEAETERTARAQFANTLCVENISAVSLKKLANSKARKIALDLDKNCPALTQRIRNWIENNNQSLAALPSTWVDIFMQQLTTLGWPGERSLNSQEYQVVDRWLKLLTEFAAFDAILGAIDFKKSLHYLTYLTTKEIFQPESPETPVQILGMLEAAELPFDYLWIMGLDDTAWPPSPKPNPFIPQRLQKILQMPHATAERELLYCQQLTRQLQFGAAEVILSYANQSDDAELRPSPIITHFPESSLAKMDLADFIAPAKKIYVSGKDEIENIIDEIAPPIAANEIIYGGTKIFKLQAACPFKAYAELRLHLKQIDPPTAGLNHKERGIIVHKALELIWKSLGNFENLHNQSSLENLIQTTIETTLAEANAEALSNKRFRELEAKRLHKLLSDWLEIEKNRRPFTVIALEKEYQTSFGGIPLNLRVDRIDQLDNGKNIIIDYKTGNNAKVSAWEPDRIDEPQLPLYCLQDPVATGAIAFAKLNTAKTEFVGLTSMDLGIQSLKIAEDWQAKIELWHAALLKTGTEFLSGEAKVYPKYGATTCKNCHIKPLCRIEETNFGSISGEGTSVESADDFNSM